MSLEMTVIGHIMKEMIHFPDHTLGPVLGGPAAYSSVVAACLGARVGLVTRIGPDMSEELLAPLFEAGVDLRGLRMGLESRHSLLIYCEDGRKTMRYPKRGEMITPADVPDEYLESGIIYVATLEEEVSLASVVALSQSGAEVAADLGGYGGAHCSEHAAGGRHDLLEQLLPRLSVAKASREDCGYLFPGRRCGDEDFARVLVDMGAGVGIVTCGTDGVVVATTEGEIVRVPALSRSVVDCTGAGDAFSAGFLFRYQAGGDAREAAIFGSATASLIIEKTGGIVTGRIPRLQDVQERITSLDVRGIAKETDA